MTEAGVLNDRHNIFLPMYYALFFLGMSNMLKDQEDVKLKKSVCFSDFMPVNSKPLPLLTNQIAHLRRAPLTSG